MIWTFVSTTMSMIVAFLVAVGMICYAKATESRCLHILLCDDRPEVIRRAVSQIVRPALKSNNDYLKVTYASVCKNKPSDIESKFTMKALYGLRYLKENATLLCEESQNYALMLDSDIWWNANSLTKLWQVYDNERRGKHLLVSSQDYCWVGRPCNRDDFDTFYPDASKDEMDPYSMFYNAGAYMGPFTHMSKLFEWMIANKDSYRSVVPKGGPYDDQYAITAYSTVVHPEEVQLDVRQALSAIPSVVSQNDRWHHYRFGRRCKEVVSCRTMKFNIRSPLLPNHCVLLNCPHDMIITDPTSCLITRNLTAYMEHNTHMDQLEKFPVLFHFAADTKRMGHEAYADRKECASKKADETAEIWNGYRYSRLRHH